MTRPGKVLLATLTGAFLISAASFVLRKEPPPRNQGEVFKRVYELQRWGRYDGAVQVLQNWLSDSRRDATNDDFLYFQVAMLYLRKAYKRPFSRNDSLHQADLNLQRAQTSYDSKPPKDVDVMLFEIGRAYEALGDLSDEARCASYASAKRALERQLPLVKEPSYSAYGHSTLLEPFRADIRKHLESINKKYSAARCEATGGTGL